jgi:hypothetical protein
VLTTTLEKKTINRKGWKPLMLFSIDISLNGKQQVNDKNTVSLCSNAYISVVFSELGESMTPEKQIICDKNVTRVVFTAWLSLKIETQPLFFVEMRLGESLEGERFQTKA